MSTKEQYWKYSLIIIIIGLGIIPVSYTHLTLPTTSRV